MTTLETMGAFVAQGLRGRLDEATRETAALHLADTLAAWVAGAQTAEGRMLIAQARTGGTPQDLAGDVGLACALARLSEIDNIHLTSGVTPGGIVIPAALTIAAARPGTGGGDLAEAVVAGVEAMVRLGAAIGGPTVLYRGIWPTYLAAPFGVAAVAARLSGLDAAQSAHALALALTLASPGVGHHNAQTTSRWLAVGHAARSGVVAAEAAQAGFTSDIGLLDGGFLQGVYGITPDLEGFARDLGATHALDGASFKPWCAARQTIAATQALREIMEAGVAPQSIRSVSVHVPPTYLKMIDHGVKIGDRASHLTSAPYLLALAACAPEDLYDVRHAPPRLADDVAAFMAKVSLAADEALLAHYPKSWPARVVVDAAGGRHERTVTAVPGDPQRPFDRHQLEAKLSRVLPQTASGLAVGLVDRCRAALGTDSDGSAALVRDIAQATAAGPRGA